MATTPHPLVWDFYRTVDGAANLGGVVHYFDEYSQTLYLDNGLVTKVAEVPEGHWETAEQEAEIQITNPDDPESEYDAWTQLRLDHPSNGVLYGVATDGGKLTFLRYIYAMDLSDFAESWSFTTQIDNAISQFDATLQNIGPDIFMTDRGLFHPGAKIRLSIRIGDSYPFKICTVWLDETDYDLQSKTMTVSGRNAVGHNLKDQTMDIDYSGEYDATEVLHQIFQYSGIKKYNIGSNFGMFSFDVKASDKLLDVVQKVSNYFSTDARKVQIVDLPDGTICIGYEDWVSTYLARGYYTFDVGSDVFKRKTTKTIDGAYTAIRVTGKDVDDNDLEPVFIEVNAFPYWALGKHRTKHIKAPDGMSQEGMRAWAEAQAKVFQYVGIGEAFSSPFRPQLIVGDIASIVEDDVATNLGIITEVKQSFSRSKGYTTDFSVDSGGVATDGENYSVYSHAADLNGFNRRQRIIDLVRYTMDKAEKIDSLRATDVGADSRGTASNLMRGHESDSTSHADIRDELTNKLPTPSTAKAGQYLRVLSVDENGNVTGVEAVTSSGGSGGGSVDGGDANTLNGKTFDEIVEAAASAATIPSVVNYSYESSTDSTTHTRSYSGTPGNTLLLAILHRGELTSAPAGWTLFGKLTESGDYNAGSTTTLQYVSVFYKKCAGSESIEYEQTMSNTSITCVIEFEGVSGFEILANSIQENVSTSTTPEFTCSRTSTRLAVWFTNSVYFSGNDYDWTVSNSSIWAISDNNGIQPRLGVFIDNRPAPTTFTIDSGMSNERYVSAFCVQIVP